MLKSRADGRPRIVVSFAEIESGERKLDHEQRVRLRKQVINELVTTEKDFVNDMQLCIICFLEPLREEVRSSSCTAQFLTCSIIACIDSCWFVLLIDAKIHASKYYT